MGSNAGLAFRTQRSAELRTNAEIVYIFINAQIHKKLSARNEAPNQALKGLVA